MIFAKPHIRKWTRAEYYRMADLGWFDNQRVELIEGTVVQMPPQKNFHVIGIDRKASLYARAKIADYWIVNLVQRQLEVRRSPVPDPAERYGWRYEDVLLLAPQERIAPLAAPKKRISVADLLP